MTLVTTAEYFTARGEEEQDVDAVEFALDAASQFVSTYCDHPFLEETVTVTILGSGSGTLYLPKPPVLDVTSVTAIYDDTETLLEADIDYTLLSDGSLWRSDGLWWYRVEAYEVVYTRGYEDVPDDVKMVVIRIAGRNRGSVASGRELASRTIGVYSEAYFESAVSGLEPEDAAVLDRYRLVTVG